MPSFRITETAYDQWQRKRLLTIIPLFAVLLIVSIGIDRIWPAAGEPDTWWLIMAITVAAVVIGCYRGLSQQKKILLNYTVTVTDQQVSLEQSKKPPVVISFMEIAEIIRSGKGNLAISSVNKKDFILIPFFIEKATALELQLSHLARIIEIKHDPWYKRFGPELTVLTATMMIVVYSLSNEVLVGVCAVGSVILCIGSVYLTRVSRHVSQAAKKRSLFLLIYLPAIFYFGIHKVMGIPFS